MVSERKCILESDTKTKVKVDKVSCPCA